MDELLTLVLTTVVVFIVQQTLIWCLDTFKSCSGNKTRKRKKPNRRL